MHFRTKGGNKVFSSASIMFLVMSFHSYLVVFIFVLMVLFHVPFGLPCQSSPVNFIGHFVILSKSGLSAWSKYLQRLLSISTFMSATSLLLFSDLSIVFHSPYASTLKPTTFPYLCFKINKINQWFLTYFSFNLCQHAR